MRYYARTIVIGVISTMVMGGCSWLGPREEKPALDVELLKMAEQYKGEELYESALAAFEMVLDENPRQMDAHLGIGDIYHVKGDYEKAAEAYEAAREIEPGNFAANYRLGLMYQLLDRVKDAVSAYLTALAIDPNDFEANLNLATAYLQMGEAGAGLPYAEAAVRLNPQSQAAQVNLGSIYSTLGRYEPAIEAYRAASDLGELQPQIALNLAGALIRTGHYDRAGNVLRTVIRAEASAAAYERMGYVEFKLGHYSDSLAMYEKALELDENDVASLNGLGVNLMAQYLAGGRSDQALRKRAIDAWQKSVLMKTDQQRIIDLIARYRNM